MRRCSWDAATSDQQFAAAEAVLLEVGDVLMENYSKLVEEAKTDETVKAQINSQIEELKGSIATFFESAQDATLKELVDASKQAAAAVTG